MKRESGRREYLCCFFLHNLQLQTRAHRFAGARLKFNREAVAARGVVHQAWGLEVSSKLDHMHAAETSQFPQGLPALSLRAQVYLL